MNGKLFAVHCQHCQYITTASTVQHTTILSHLLISALCLLREIIFPEEIVDLFFTVQLLRKPNRV
jgi:hypothetical protein